MRSHARFLGGVLAILVASLACPVRADVLQGLSSTVVLLRGTRPDGRPATGTGFFVLGTRYPFLVTAAHVARTLSPQSSVTMKVEGDKPLTIVLSDLTGPAPSSFRYSKEADVAVARVSPKTTELQERLKAHFLPHAMLVAEKRAPARSITLTVLGFPLALGVDRFFSPISRETKPASGLVTVPVAGESADVFLTQDPSVGGFSGAPVFDTMLPTSGDGAAFTVRGGTPQLVGIAIATLSDDTGGKMGAVVPSYFIVEAMKLDEQ